jgi:hypothetical protein
LIKIFENDSIILCLGKCLAEDYLPANIDTVCELIIKRIIPINKNYSTSTVVVNNIIRDATFEELKNIEELYRKGGYLRLIDYRHKDGCFNIHTGFQLPILGRFVGMPSDETITKTLLNFALNDLSKHIPGNKIDDFNNDVKFKEHLKQYFK